MKQGCPLHMTRSTLSALQSLKGAAFKDLVPPSPCPKLSLLLGTAALLTQVIPFEGYLAGPSVEAFPPASAATSLWEAGVPWILFSINLVLSTFPIPALLPLPLPSSWGFTKWQDSVGNEMISHTCADLPDPHSHLVWFHGEKWNIDSVHTSFLDSCLYYPIAVSK